MTRPLRIQYPGAWYHIMNRGRRRENIFFSNEDYSALIEVLKEAVSLWNINIAAYCLMPNHYHLLLQTPEGNPFTIHETHKRSLHASEITHMNFCEGQAIFVQKKQEIVDLRD